jgi:hypothetical protein
MEIANQNNNRGGMMYKFLKLIDNKTVSGYDKNFVWEIGKWYKVKGKLEMCNNGFHCSEQPLDALGYVQGEVIAIVETKGKSKVQDDKQCWQEMRIIKAHKWTKKDSVALAIYSAELVLNNFEKEYPDDDRPRKAIEAAKRVLKRDTAKNRSAARSAAESAAGSAAWSAARSAGSAESAARSAESAARSAGTAALKETLDKINIWIINHINQLEEITIEE